MASPRSQVDPRGLRFAAAVTSAVLAVVILLGPTPAAGWLLLAQAVVFAAGAVVGLRVAPYGVVWRRYVRPRLGTRVELEDEAPPRFAQAVGLVFATLGTIGFLAGVPALGYVATGFALVAALLNATVGLCLGCETYLIVKRVTSPRKEAIV
jgi:hypothetical protein